MKFTSFFNSLFKGKRTSKGFYPEPLTKEQTLEELSLILISREKESNIIRRITQLGANSSRSDLEIASEVCQLIQESPCDTTKHVLGRLNAYANGYAKQSIQSMQDKITHFNAH